MKFFFSGYGLSRIGANTLVPSNIDVDLVNPDSGEYLMYTDQPATFFDASIYRSPKIYALVKAS